MMLSQTYKNISVKYIYIFKLANTLGKDYANVEYVDMVSRH